MCFKNEKQLGVFVQNISTCLFDTFPPTSLICFTWLSLRTMFMSPDLASVFFHLIWVTKLWRAFWKLLGHFPFKKKKAKTQTCNILITGSFEVLYVTTFNKILCSRAVLLVKNEDSDSVGLEGIWYPAFLTSSHVSVLVWGLYFE